MSPARAHLSNLAHVLEALRDDYATDGMRSVADDPCVLVARRATSRSTLLTFASTGHTKQDASEIRRRAAPGRLSPARAGGTQISRAAKLRARFSPRDSK
jgi:hypothetical protein